MEDFVVSARKYRPKTFGTVVGQEKITQTLLRAIENNHLAQAFLFCGPRGVGKTTCARILARTVNQYSQPDSDAENDFSFNIFELDAASNNSVDDIRSLIDQVRIPPQIGKYKIYIIDEVHMLSTNAFNAFLKTLEEPPPYAIFILATTEKHKVLPTIISRCQIFDFNRIQIPEMVSHLRGIAQKENISVESDALHIIAEKADGALRDALSIFDQMVSFSGNSVTYQNVIDHLNILDYDHYFSLTDAFLQGNRTEVLLTFNTILNNGFDGHNFVNGLASHLRNLLFCVSPETAALLEVGDNIRDKYLEQSKACETRFLLNSLNILSETDVNYKASRNPRLLVEINLMKLCGLSAKNAEKKNDDGLESLNQPDRQVTEKPKPPAAPKVTEQKLPENRVSEPLPETAPQKNDPREPSDAPVLVPQKTNQQVNENTPGEENVGFPVENDETKSSENSEDQNKTQEAPVKNLISSGKPLEAPVPAKPAGNPFSSRLSMGKTKGMSSINSLSKEIIEDVNHVGANHQRDPNEIDLYDGRLATPFNLAELWKFWDQYANGIKNDDRQSYFATLTRRKPIMRDKYKIELLLDNGIQKGDLDSDKSNLLMFLREKLNNWHIQLEGIVEEGEDENDSQPYTADAKYKEMLKINPQLGKMREMFDLEVDFDD